MNNKLKELKIELTYKCKLACIHCSSNGHLENNQQIGFNECTKIINDAVKLGVDKIIFSGGDPLLWNKLPELIYQCTQNNIYTEVFTSGYIYDFEDCIHRLTKNGLSRITFSLYGASKESHEKITRISESYEKVINAIKYSQKTNLDTHLHFVALSINYKELIPIYELSKELGISSISILRFVPQGRGLLLKDYVLSKKESNGLKNIIIKLRNQGPIPIRTGSPWNYLFINNNPKCMAGIDRLTIKPNLHIAPCDAFKNIEDIDLLGKKDKNSRLTESTLINCWTQSEYLNTIRSIVSKDRSACFRCFCYNKCSGGCAAQTYIHFRNFNYPDPSCLLGK